MLLPAGAEDRGGPGAVGNGYSPKAKCEAHVLQVYRSEHARIWTKRTKEVAAPQKGNRYAVPGIDLGRATATQELEQARERVKRYGKEAESYAQGTAGRPMPLCPCYAISRTTSAYYSGESLSVCICIVSLVQKRGAMRLRAILA
eukprot:1810526-Rhodomonas_salina.4